MEHAPTPQQVGHVSHARWPPGMPPTGAGDTLASRLAVTRVTDCPRGAVWPTLSCDACADAGEAANDSKTSRSSPPAIRDTVFAQPAILKPVSTPGFSSACKMVLTPVGRSSPAR